MPTSYLSTSFRRTSNEGNASSQRPNHDPSQQFSLEELSEDDVGYDGDVEVVRPEYEDVESDSRDDNYDEGYDSDSSNSEDQLARQLSGLYCDPMLVADPQQSPRKGKKRMVKDVDGSAPRTEREDLEVMELSVHADDIQPAKRRRKRLARSKNGERIVNLIEQERSEQGVSSGVESETMASSPISTEQGALIEGQEHEMMDMS